MTKLNYNMKYPYYVLVKLPSISDLVYCAGTARIPSDDAPSWCFITELDNIFLVGEHEIVGRILNIKPLRDEKV